MVEGIDDNTANQDQLKREDGEEVDIEAFFTFDSSAFLVLSLYCQMTIDDA